MIELMLAALAMQAADPCLAVDAAARPSGCTAWRSVHQAPGGEFFVDPASLRREGGRVEVRVWTIFRQAQRENLHSVVSRDRYDCAAGSFTLLRFTAYDATGRQLADFEPTGENALPITPSPGSPNAALLAEFCPR